MALRKRTVAVVVPVMVVALLGLIGLQAYLLNNAFQLREQAFNRNVWSALLAVPLRLQARETLTETFRVQGDRGSQPGRRRKTTIRQSVASGPSGSDTAFFVQRLPPPPVRVEGNAVFYHIGSPQRVRVTVSDGLGSDTLLLDSLKGAGDHTVTFDAPARKGTYFYRLTTDSANFVVQVANGAPGPVLRPPASESERAILVSRVIDNLWVSDTASVEKRFNPVMLDSVLRRTMREAGISLDFAYGVLTGRGDSTGREAVRLAHPAGSEPALRASEFRTPLSPFEVAGPRAQLVLDFPGRNVYLLQQLWPVLLASLVFIILIAAGFISTVRTIMKQQRLADLMVDFINNMTHEFKTPLSTVALANEAISRPDVVRHTVKVLKYSGMIADETLRMKKQVDRILDMSQLEEGDFELSLDDVDMHELVRTAARNFTLQVESRGGTLTLDLQADVHTLRGDAMHLAIIIHNLLDNANKYSPAAPAIEVSSRNEGRWLVIKVADHGVGIAPDHVKKVFDKYYRVPTGNLHAVKGFGIGLSYVKLLVAVHRGEVSLKSQPGVGTEVTLRFPPAATSPFERHSSETNRPPS